MKRIIIILILFYTQTAFSFGMFGGGGGGITDHGSLTGLGDNDHGAIYYTETEVDSQMSGKETADAAIAKTDENEIVTGFWSVAFQEIIQTSTDTLTAAECKGTIINNYGQSAEMTLTLPAAAKGLKFLYVLGTAAQTSHIKAGAGDKHYFDGTALDDGDKVSNNGAASAVGDMILFFTFQTGSGTYDWMAQTIYGTFTDGGA